jgi:hypothetical protein
MESLMPAVPSSVYAEEGTCAHELAELKASVEFGKISRATFNKRVDKWRSSWVVSDVTEFEMQEHTDRYVELIREELSIFPNSHVSLEQRLDTGVPKCWGTSDAVIVSPEHVGIVDFKYGRGVAVEAENNPQLRLYGLGALDTFGDLIADTEVVRITVHQPRLDHVLTEVITPDALRAWRETVIPIALVALGDDAPFGPSEVACRWCPASGNCRAQLESVFADEAEFTVEPETLDTEELATLLAKIPAIREWCDAVESTAFRAAYNDGKVVPGYKIVLGGGKRSIIDPEAAIEHAVSLGYERDQVARLVPRTLGEFEALMTKPGFAEKMADYIKPAVGKPSLVPDSDKRPAVSSNAEAARVFADEN